MGSEMCIRDSLKNVKTENINYFKFPRFQISGFSSFSPPPVTSLKLNTLIDKNAEGADLVDVLYVGDCFKRDHCAVT